ncbi:MAG: endonuclease III [Bacteroidetes bacterium HGW-Bacteroidetes-9]|jgi:endonuclease-3|nr:MAG: endonuclease III [Bacteroidetes bacterium HGW-Bacteroidetes-9]
MPQKLTKPERFKAVIAWFEKNMPVAETELKYKSPYELIVAVILSAQCTDKRVNMITPPFFKQFPSVEILAKSNEEEVFELIRSCSYPNNKTKHLLGMARMLTDKFSGKVPSDIETLQQLPGVGRKTANVIASVAFDLPAMAVDTHVHRVSARIGLTYRAKNPLETERQLVKYIPESKLSIAHHWLILHGRYVCIARKPKCTECGLKDWCRYFTSEKQGKD